MWSNLSVFFLSFFYNLRNKMYFLIMMIKRNTSQCSSSSCVISFLYLYSWSIWNLFWYIICDIYQTLFFPNNLPVGQQSLIWVIVAPNILPLSYNTFLHVLGSISGFSILFFCSLNRKFEVNFYSILSGRANIFSYIFLFSVFLPHLVCLLFHTNFIIYLFYNIKLLSCFSRVWLCATP